VVVRGESLISQAVVCGLAVGGAGGTLRLLAALFVLVPALALADITGPAPVIDGDTIEVAGQRIRLHGIDAPESAQQCKLKGKSHPCGEIAVGALKRAVSMARAEGWSVEGIADAEDRLHLYRQGRPYRKRR
jgi:endonuclease YncB( thermonuclease family)